MFTLNSRQWGASKASCTLAILSRSLQLLLQGVVADVEQKPRGLPQRREDEPADIRTPSSGVGK